MFHRIPLCEQTCRTGILGGGGRWEWLWTLGRAGDDGERWALVELGPLLLVVWWELRGIKSRLGWQARGQSMENENGERGA